MHIVLSTIVLLFIILFISKIKIHKNKHNEKTIIIILGSGGHTGEMERLLNGWKIEKRKKLQYKKRTYICTTKDNVSINAIKRIEGINNNFDSENKSFSIEIIPRARYVGQSWITTPFTSILCAFKCMRLIYFYNPDVLLCNGPGTCVIVVLITRFFNLLSLFIHNFKNTQIIYVESFARVFNLSLSGKLLLPFVNKFIVQWPQLKEKYKSVDYYGVLV